MQQIQMHILQMESQMLPEHARGWVLREALEQKYLPDYGTFRASLVLCIEDKIIPIWNTLLSIIDENNNLMTLHLNPERNAYVWVKLFVEFCAAEEHKEKALDEIRMQVYPRFPFSRRICLKLDELMVMYVRGGIIYSLLFLLLKSAASQWAKSLKSSL